MNVAAILRQKGRSVTTASPETMLLDVVKVLNTRRIGAIAIMGPKGRLAGIISERDIIHAMSARGPVCLTRPVSESMTREVITCEESDTLDDLMALMTARRVRHLPVVIDEALVGIVSIGDVVKHHVTDVTMEATAMREYIMHT
jgi:CBS domain-containing protein